MFERVDLQMNLGETKVMVFTPGFIWRRQSEAAYKRLETLDGEMFRERNRARLSGEVCRAMMLELLLCHNMEITHCKIFSHTHGVDIVGAGADMCVISLPFVLMLVTCLVEGCPERAHNPGRLCKKCT